MDWGNLASGFLGAAVGVVATMVIYWFDRRNNQRNAGQALRAELANNFTNLKLIADPAIGPAASVPLSWELWITLAPAVAGLMGRKFTEVAFAYFHIPQAEAIRLRHTGGGSGPSVDEMTELVVARDAVRAGMQALSTRLGEPLPRE